MTAFLIGFAAAKDGDFSAESVQAPGQRGRPDARQAPLTAPSGRTAGRSGLSGGAVASHLGWAP
jgi:hypothetical protein